MMAAKQLEEGGEDEQKAWEEEGMEPFCNKVEKERGAD